MPDQPANRPTHPPTKPTHRPPDCRLTDARPLPDRLTERLTGRQTDREAAIIAVIARGRAKTKGSTSVRPTGRPWAPRPPPPAQRRAHRLPADELRKQPVGGRQVGRAPAPHFSPVLGASRVPVDAEPAPLDLKSHVLGASVNLLPMTPEARHLCKAEEV